LGEQDLKNIARRVRAYAVVRAGSGPMIQSGRARPTPFSPPPLSIAGAGCRSRSSIQVSTSTRRQPTEPARRASGEDALQIAPDTLLNLRHAPVHLGAHEVSCDLEPNAPSATSTRRRAQPRAQAGDSTFTQPHSFSTEAPVLRSS
jgi:hypothetical protein